jgi:hypothetical protein
MADAAQPGGFFRVLQAFLRVHLLARYRDFQHGIHMFRIALQFKLKLPDSVVVVVGFQQQPPESEMQVGIVREFGGQ